MEGASPSGCENLLFNGWTRNVAFFCQSMPAYQFTASRTMPSIPVSSQKRITLRASPAHSLVVQLYCGR